MAVKRREGFMEIPALNPYNGRFTAGRQFINAKASMPIDNADPGFVWRQAFNRDLTAVAAAGPLNADGSQGSGIVKDDGSYTELTASTSDGYGTVLRKVGVGFNPKTDDLWYMAGDSFGRVKTAIGADSDQLVKGVAPHANSMIGGLKDRVYFMPNGVPSTVAAITLGGSLFFSNGIEVEQDPVYGGYRFGPYGKVTESTPLRPLTPRLNRMGYMAIVVDDHSFITKYDSQLYLNTVRSNYKSVSVRPLLPDSNRAVGDIAVSPDHQSIAFVSSAGSVAKLWTLALTKGSVPEQLTEYYAENLPYGLIDWLP